MAAVPTDELNIAIDRWLAIQTKDPAWLADYINKQNNGRNPFDPWPPEKEDIDKFLGASTSFEHAIKVLTPEKRQELVEEFDREFEKVKNARSAAEVAAKKRTQEVIRRTLEEKSVAAEEKGVLFRTLKDRTDQEPEKPVVEQISEAVEEVETRRVFATPLTETQVETVTQESRFSKPQGLNPVQKAITAPFLDAVTTVFPGLKQGVLNKNLEASVRGVFDTPNRLLDLFGQKVVEQPLFQQMLSHATRGIGQGVPGGGAKTILDDIALSILRGPAEQSVVSYWNVYRINVAQGLPPPSAAQFQAASMGLGSTLFQLGKGYVGQKAGNVAFRAGLAKLGLAAIPGGGWAAAAFSIGSSLFNKAVNWFKSLGATRPGEVPGDRAILILLAAVALIFFIPIFPLLNFQAFNQLNIDTSLAMRFVGGPGTSGAGPSFPTYPGAPAIPSNVTGCPTKNAFSLTQCPGSTYSHDNLWAYDIGYNGQMGVPVYATHDGVVAVTTDTGHSGGYGNMVEIKGVTPQGTTYYTLYGHFANWTVRVGQQVKAGDLIGYGNNTGNSSGPHLHYEYRDANNRASPAFGINFLPAACVTNPGTCNLR